MLVHAVVVRFFRSSFSHVVVTVHDVSSFVGWREQVGGRCNQVYIFSNIESEMMLLLEAPIRLCSTEFACVLCEIVVDPWESSPAPARGAGELETSIGIRATEGELGAQPWRRGVVRGSGHLRARRPGAARRDVVRAIVVDAMGGQCIRGRPLSSALCVRRRAPATGRSSRRPTTTHGRC